VRKKNLRPRGRTRASATTKIRWEMVSGKYTLRKKTPRGEGRKAKKSKGASENRGAYTNRLGGLVGGGLGELGGPKKRRKANYLGVSTKRPGQSKVRKVFGMGKSFQ